MTRMPHRERMNGRYKLRREFQGFDILERK
jgi:hypothetical protein